ncbi:tyrosyl-DNA phosphodiesterase I, partial [Delphinella strobiligena]
LRICFPSMEGQINCMHSKLMLLFHPHKLRVAIPSANLVKYDWGETGVMENSVFLVDLPRLPEDQATQQELTPFGEELVYFLEKQGLDDTVRQSLYKFDFSATVHLAFVHSTGGANYSEEMQRTGYMGLNRAVRNLGLTSDTDLQIDFTASSIGSLNDDQLRYIHTAARGETDTNPAPKTKKAQPASTMPSVRDHFRIYFPTLETVAASTGGVNNGGTICMQRKWWEGVNAFPRDCFRDYQSIRKGLLSHNKIL